MQINLYNRIFKFIIYRFNYTQMYESMEQMEIQYGGLDPGVTHVIITNGELDPWFPLGILEYDEPLSYHINIPCKC